MSLAWQAGDEKEKGSRAGASRKGWLVMGKES